MRTAACGRFATRGSLRVRRRRGNRGLRSDVRAAAVGRGRRDVVIRGHHCDDRVLTEAIADFRGAVGNRDCGAPPRGFDDQVSRRYKSAQGASKRLALIGRATGRPELLRLGELPRRADEPDVLVADITRLRDELGFRPSVALEPGIAATVAALSRARSA